MKPQTLLRHWLQRAMCDPKSGYFAKPVINSPTAPLNFTGLSGEGAYRTALNNLYDAGDKVSQKFPCLFLCLALRNAAHG